MALDEQIKPFTLVRGTKSTSLILGACEWQQAVFDERGRRLSGQRLRLVLGGGCLFERHPARLA